MKIKGLSKARMKHCENVGKLASALSKIHGWNSDKAYQAGLFHDCVKEWKPKALIQYVKRHKISVPGFDFIVKASPNMLHAYVGSHYAKKMRWVQDSVSLKAIRSHTLGSIHMNLADKILYVADLASYDRRFKEAKTIRALAKKNLNLAYKASVQTKIYYQIKLGRPIHPLAVKIWNTLVPSGIKI